MTASWVELFVWVPPNNDCAAGQYDLRGSASWECSDLTACVRGSTYETTAPTNTSDRGCSPVSTCDFDGQWEQSVPTLVDDRECACGTFYVLLLLLSMLATGLQRGCQHSADTAPRHPRRGVVPTV